MQTNRGVIETKHVLCNGNPSMVYATMVPPEVIPERMIKLANARKHCARMFVVYLGLDKSAEELGLHLHAGFR